MAAAAAAVLAPLFLVIGELYNELETIFESSTLALHTNSEAKTMFTSQQEVLDWNREK